MAVLSKAIHGLWEASLSMSQAETVPLFFGTLQVDKAFYFWEQGGQELPVMGTSQLPVPMHMTETLAQEGTLFLLGFSVLGTFQLLSGSADILWFDNYTSRSLQDPHGTAFHDLPHANTGTGRRRSSSHTDPNRLPFDSVLSKCLSTSSVS